MTDTLENAFAKARELPTELHDEIAQVLLDAVENRQDPVQLTDEELESLRPSLEQARRRQFASTEKVAATWRRHGLDAP